MGEAGDRLSSICSKAFAARPAVEVGYRFVACVVRSRPCPRKAGRNDAAGGHELSGSFAALERFLNDSTHPPLVTAGLAHAQFETIHPFLDGNGRVGRLLITLVLVERQVLKRPLLYLSLFLQQNRGEYHERLSAIRAKGDWEAWLRFFLMGVSAASNDAMRVASEIADLRNRHLREVGTENLGRYAVPTLDLLVEHPVVTVQYVVERVGGTPTSIGGLFDKLVAMRIIEEITGHKRNRVYRYSPFMDLFS